MYAEQLGDAATPSERTIGRDTHHRTETRVQFEMAGVKSKKAYDKLGNLNRCSQLIAVQY